MNWQKAKLWIRYFERNNIMSINTKIEFEEVLIPVFKCDFIKLEVRIDEYKI
jgi:hypothetical protein